MKTYNKREKLFMTRIVNYDFKKLSTLQPLLIKYYFNEDMNCALILQNKINNVCLFTTEEESQKKLHELLEIIFLLERLENEKYIKCFTLSKRKNVLLYNKEEQSRKLDCTISLDDIYEYLDKYINSGFFISEDLKTLVHNNFLTKEIILSTIAIVISIIAIVTSVLLNVCR